MHAAYVQQSEVVAAKFVDNVVASEATTRGGGMQQPPSDTTS
jgi:hypothetical protein